MAGRGSGSYDAGLELVGVKTITLHPIGNPDAGSSPLPTFHQKGMSSSSMPVFSVRAALGNGKLVTT